MPYLPPFTCSFHDHHPDALTERFGAPKLVGECSCKLVILPFGLTLRASEWDQGSLGLCRVPSCREAEIGCCSAAPSAFPFGQTLRDREGAKASLSLLSTRQWHAA